VGITIRRFRTAPVIRGACTARNKNGNNKYIYIRTKGIQTTHGEIWNNKKFIFCFFMPSRVLLCAFIIYHKLAPLYLTDGVTVWRCRHVHLITDSIGVQ